MITVIQDKLLSGCGNLNSPKIFISVIISYRYVQIMSDQIQYVVIIGYVSRTSPAKINV